MRRKILALLCAAPVFLLPGAAAGADAWSLAVVQGGKSFNAEGAVRLEKKPFKLVFTGARNWGYGVLASVECAELDGLNDEAGIAEKIRPTNIGAEDTQRQSRFLTVHAKGAVASDDSGSQVWFEDAKSDAHLFQGYEVKGDGTAVATREINEIYLYINYKDMKQYKIEAAPLEKVCVLMTGLPPVGRMAHVSPKHFVINFR